MPLIAHLFLRNVARLKTVECSYHLNNGESAQAKTTSSELLAIGQMALKGDGCLVHYMVAMGVYRMALDALNAVVFHSKTTHDSLRDLRRQLVQHRPQPEALARVYRVEVSYCHSARNSTLAANGRLTKAR